MAEKGGDNSIGEFARRNLKDTDPRLDLMVENLTVQIST